MLGWDSLQFLKRGKNFGVVGHLLIDGLKDAPGEIVFAGSIESQAEDTPKWQVVGIPVDQDLQSFGRLLPFASIDVDLGGSEIESVSPAIQSVRIQPLGTRFIQSANGCEDLRSQSVTVRVIGADSNGLINEFKGFGQKWIACVPVGRGKPSLPLEPCVLIQGFGIVGFDLHCPGNG